MANRVWGLYYTRIIISNPHRIVLVVIKAPVLGSGPKVCWVRVLGVRGFRLVDLGSR